MKKKLDPKAVVAANEKLWKNNPELKGRQLTMGPEDIAYRKEWMKHYKEAEKETPVPPKPAIEPEQVSDQPNSSVEEHPVLKCGIAKMSHQQKMEEAIRRANLGPEIMEELGDIETLVASMVIVGGVLIAIAATGYGAIAEAIAVGLLLLGAYLSGAQIGEGINSLIDFYERTRCDRAKTSEDLDAAGESFGDAIAKMGVGGLNVLLSILGGRKVPGKTKPKTNRPKVLTKKLPNAKKGKRYEEFEMSEHYKKRDAEGIFQDGKPVKYFDDAELAKHRVIADDEGRLIYAESGKRVNTGENGIYVMDKSGNVYVHENAQTGVIHHSSFKAGKPISGGGDIKVKDGKVNFMNDKTGHYGSNQPKGQVKVVAKELKNQGVKMDAAEVQVFEKKRSKLIKLKYLNL